MLRNLVLLAVSIPLLYVGLMMGASEFAEEVVTLRTYDPDGKSYETSLWIVEDKRGDLWLRAGQSGSGWLERIRVNPDVDLVRAGTTSPRTAEVLPKNRDKIHAMMRERYGWADIIVSGMRDGSESIAVRLDERGSLR
jgi:hypothetical protein